ncbi:hypothetical protein [Azorhizobium doebereinerae]|uniref:hypothetical protein n=1 Tax=Azorhizobium doebereinerae TaxID=281091 RepID=UPI000429EFA6|nr:hypothetical protein [Azorhizobium doebereinerae]
MRKLTLATAALLAVSTIGASAQSGLSTQDPHQGPAEEGGRTQATPGASSTTGVTPRDGASTPTARSGISSQDTHKGAAQEGGRTQATPGASSSGGSTMDTTGSITPRSGLSSQDANQGPAQEGGRTQATPGATR